MFDHTDELKILKKSYEGTVNSFREMLLANLIMISQVPAPTFDENERAQFVLDRFIQTENTYTCFDNYGNVCASIHGENKTEKNILICTNLDTPFPKTLDHTVTIHLDEAKGVGIAYNSMALATLVSLPEIIKKLSIKYRANIMFLATRESAGRGDHEGMRKFIRKSDFKPDYVINLMSTHIGRVDHFCRSVVRCDISCSTKPSTENSWINSVSENSIYIINELINNILAIPLPGRPRTSLNLGMISGGESYGTPSVDTSLNLEIKSESDKQTDELILAVKDSCIDVESRYDQKIECNFWGRQKAGGLRFTHPLVKSSIEILKFLGYPPFVGPSNSQIAVPSALGIPSVTLALTNGERHRLKNASIKIKPISDGILQILMLLDFLDKGYCDE